MTDGSARRARLNLRNLSAGYVENRGFGCVAAMTEEVCGEIKEIDGLTIYCGKPPHPEAEIHNAIIDDGESGSTSIGWWTH